MKAAENPLEEEIATDIFLRRKNKARGKKGEKKIRDVLPVYGLHVQREGHEKYEHVIFMNKSEERKRIKAIIVVLETRHTRSKNII